MSNQNKTFSVRKLAIIGLLSALVFIFSWVQVPIGQIARVHLGNVFCVLSGLLFGPLVGGLSSGFGSMLFDFTNPVYIAESWITFITKFFIGFLEFILLPIVALASVIPFLFIPDFVTSRTSIFFMEFVILWVLSMVAPKIINFIFKFL